jgi:hypothetical protein
MGRPKKKDEDGAMVSIVGGPEYTMLANDVFPSHGCGFVLSKHRYRKSRKSGLERMVIGRAP